MPFSGGARSTSLRFGEVWSYLCRTCLDPPPPPRARPRPRRGGRLRQLRVAAGMTQTDLAGERFSKEYVSQIERGKTRPTRETVEWLPATPGGEATFPL